jgi:hypothetical protein
LNQYEKRLEPESNNPANIAAGIARLTFDLRSFELTWFASHQEVLGQQSLVCLVAWAGNLGWNRSHLSCHNHFPIRVGAGLCL